MLKIGFLNSVSGLNAFLKDAAALMGVLVASKAFRYIATIIIARNLTVTDFGYYAYFLQLAGYLGVIIEIGLPTSIIVLNIRRGIPLSSIFQTILIFAIVSSGILYLLITKLELQFLNEPLLKLGTIEMILVLVYGYSIFIGNVLTACVRAKEKNNLYSQLMFLLGILILAATVLTLIFTNFTLTDVLLSIIWATITWLVIVSVLNLDLFKSPKLPKLSRVKEIFSFGLKNYLTRLLSSATYLFPFIFISSSSFPTALGYLGAAAIFLSIIRLIGQSLSLLLTAKLSSLTKEKSFVFTIAISSGFFCMVLLVFPILFLALDPIITFLYGEKYIPAVTVVRFALIGVAFEILTTLLIRSFITNENPKHYLQWLVYLTIISVMAIFLLTANYGDLIGLLNIVGSGIAISSFFGFLVALFLLFYERNRKSKKIPPKQDRVIIK